MNATMTLTKTIQALPPPLKAPLWPVRWLGIKVIRTARRMSAPYRLRRPKGPIKLHLGCGQRRLSGFINIDMNWSPATDYRCDIARLPCPDSSVARIETYHVIEHIPRPRVEQVLGEWYRVLEPGGVLVIECPDFRGAVDEWLAGNEERMYTIFGRQRFPGDAHHWGYTEESLSELVRQVGFAGVSTLPARDYHTRSAPCIRVEAAK